MHVSAWGSAPLTPSCGKRTVLYGHAAEHPDQSQAVPAVRSR
jgi:hypothetical protein